MTREASKEDVGGDGRDDDQADDGEDFQNGHKEQQACQHLLGNSWCVCGNFDEEENTSMFPSELLKPPGTSLSELI